MWSFRLYFEITMCIFMKFSSLNILNRCLLYPIFFFLLILFQNKFLFYVDISKCYLHCSWNIFIMCIKITDVCVYKQLFCYSHSKPNILNFLLPNNIVYFSLDKISYVFYELISVSFICLPFFISKLEFLFIWYIKFS